MKPQCAVAHAVVRGAFRGAFFVSDFKGLRHATSLLQSKNFNIMVGMGVGNLFCKFKLFWLIAVCTQKKTKKLNESETLLARIVVKAAVGPRFKTLLNRNKLGF